MGCREVGEDGGGGLYVVAWVLDVRFADRGR